MYSIKVKPVKFGHPNKQVLTQSPAPGVSAFEGNPAGGAIYSPTFVVHLSFRMAKLQDNRLSIHINDLRLDRYMKDQQTL